MTPSDAARLSALEARERARDALLLALADGMTPLNTEKWRVISARRFDLGCTVAESRGTPGPSPETIARVRETLNEILERCDPDSETGADRGVRHAVAGAREALRLLGAEPQPQSGGTER